MLNQGVLCLPVSQWHQQVILSVTIEAYLFLLTMKLRLNYDNNDAGGPDVTGRVAGGERDVGPRLSPSFPADIIGIVKYFSSQSFIAQLTAHT